MFNLIRNEFIKIGLFKILFPFILFLIVIIIEYYFKEIILFQDIISLIPYIGIVLCIIFSGLISNEIESGTFKYYLTKSKPRRKVLTSKILMAYIYTFILSSFVLSIFLLNENLIIKEILKYYICTCPLYFMVSLTILLSIIIKNTPINSGICIILLCFGALISEMLFKNSITFIEYTFLPYLDFSILVDYESINIVNMEYSINLNMYYGIFINILFIIIFNIISFYIFIKKDIKS